jgi:hypothetical protein
MRTQGSWNDDMMIATHVSSATNITSDNKSHPKGGLMPFTLNKDRSRCATDYTMNSRIFIKNDPQIEYKELMFASPDMTLDFGIRNDRDQ